MDLDKMLEERIERSKEIQDKLIEDEVEYFMPFTWDEVESAMRYNWEQQKLSDKS